MLLSKLKFITLLFIVVPFIGFSQNCTLTLTGHISDVGTGEPIPYANIFVSETKKGTVSDSSGHFKLTNLCTGDYHITLSHIGCESKKVFVKIEEKDIDLDLKLTHSVHDLDNVALSSSSKSKTTQKVEIINERFISDNAGKNLADITSSIVGVSTIKTGNSIGKPIINGLFGNRISILNNGIPQSGQQWGIDHSPEIDPLVANKISVIKGTAGLEYLGAPLGGVILVEPEKIEKEPHLHGKTNYFFESNGLSNGINLQLQQYPSNIGWKANATFRRSGDLSTPDYTLINTGVQEINLALQLEKEFSKKLKTDFYFSTFNTTLAILRASQIGNALNLKEITERGIPFITGSSSFNIDAPKQKVNHHLAKFHSKYSIDFSQWVTIDFAGQLNQRKEFDRRRGGRSNRPALSLDQYTIYIGGKYFKRFSSGFNLKSGIQYNFIDNENQAGTGVLPLIPDYTSHQIGLFTTLTKSHKKSVFEFGARYDNINQHVATITRDLPIRVERFDNSFHNISTSVGWNFAINPHLSISYNLGYATRNPAINELYSSGLHQGVAALEFGDPNLKNEKAIKTTLGITGDIKEKFSFEAHGYFQKFDDYIFLNPRGQIQRIARGAFLVFNYEQTNAQIAGLDLSAAYQFTASLQIKATASLIDAKNITDNNTLIYTPTNTFTGSVTYEYPKAIPFIGSKKLENLKLTVKNEYVSESTTEDEEYIYFENNEQQSFFIAPPKAYNFLSLQSSTDIQLNKTRLRITGNITNILNTTYTNYLDRQRYFVVAQGINATLGMSLKF